jgi:hypothetical protein
MGRGPGVDRGDKFIGKANGAGGIAAGCWSARAGAFTAYLFSYCFFHSLVIRYSSLQSKRPAVVVAHRDEPDPNQRYIMAQANDTFSIPTCELSLRIQLRRSGLRLRRSGFHYQVMLGEQVLIAGNGRGEALSLDEIEAFINRAMVR